jgi:hypothetical protein
MYDELQRREASLNAYFDLLDENKTHERAQKVVDAFLTLLDIPFTKESAMAALTRIVNLRDDALVQVMRKEGFDEETIRVKKELAYGFVSTLHMTRHEDFIAWVEEKKLLTPFYRALLLGVHYVGVRLSEWQSRWTHHIIDTINTELSGLFEGDEAKIFEHLEACGLLDCDEEGNLADRCYSVLVKDEAGNYRSVAYAEAFEKEVEGVLAALEELIALLSRHEDEVFDQKEAWIAYFEALYEAFSNKHIETSLKKWAEVDRRWMAITTPLQVGHPLEYYEDHYRKAVALEWDVRIVNPALQSASHTREHIKLFAYETAKKLGEEAERIMTKNLLQVDAAQLYIGRPALYYAAEFNGLFSAQVVPNDETVSAELGKKIFAFADYVLESKRAKPIMRLNVEIMGEDFVRKQRKMLDEAPELWHKVYDISTIGHEFGHILWIDADTEAVMNATGQFKNIEEFKATTGGLMAFFRKEDPELVEYVTDDLVSRAVGLMAWREVGEVLPYYCEGLIHLELLFASGAVRFDERIVIDYTRYDALKAHYMQTYEDLARHYVAKKDAAAFLYRFVEKKESVYLPKTPQVRDFVEHYYARYKAIGQEIVTLKEV